MDTPFSRGKIALVKQPGVYDSGKTYWQYLAVWIWKALVLFIFCGLGHRLTLWKFRKSAMPKTGI